jgi:hypothetical protein
MIWKVNYDGSATLTLESQSSNLATGQAGGFFTSVSSNGTEPGSAIVWAVSRPVRALQPNVRLYALDAATSETLYSEVAGTWPYTTGAANIVPTIINGRVYVPSYKELTIFGLGSPAGAAEVAQAKTVRAQALADANAWPSLNSGEHAIYGIVRDLDGSTISFKKRDGTMVSVDFAEATKLKQVAAPVVGRAALIRYRYEDTGILIATAVLHATPQPDLWPQDR